MEFQLGQAFLLTLVARGGALSEIRFGPAQPGGGAREEAHPVLREACRQLAEYWAGRRKTFTFPWQADGTAFQQAVWALLTRIPYGEVRTYAQVAQALGKPRALRAVGAANAANPLPLVIPCHRVVASGGGFGGYSGGFSLKRALLSLEGALPKGQEALLPGLLPPGA